MCRRQADVDSGAGKRIFPALRVCARQAAKREKMLMPAAPQSAAGLPAARLPAPRLAATPLPAALLLAVASALLSAAAPGETRVSVPEDHGPQEVAVVAREFPVGGGSGWHAHAGIEIGRVVSGVTEMRLESGEVRRYAAGETFVIPRGVVHNGVNVADVPARLVVTYLLDRGAPLRSDAPDPLAR